MVARGTVSAFDERAGLGEVTADDATVYPFHCTVIADGSRTVAVGATVEFEIAPGPLGQWEAAAIIPSPITPIRGGS